MQHAYHEAKKPGFTSVEEGFDESPDKSSEIIDEEELKMIRQLKDLKKEYRAIFGELKDLRQAINFAQQGIDAAKQKLVSEFEAWYVDTFEEDVVAEQKGVSPVKVSSRLRG